VLICCSRAVLPAFWLHCGVDRYAKAPRCPRREARDAACDPGPSELALIQLTLQELGSHSFGTNHGYA